MACMAVRVPGSHTAASGRTGHFTEAFIVTTPSAFSRIVPCDAQIQIDNRARPTHNDHLWLNPQQRHLGKIFFALRTGKPASDAITPGLVDPPVRRT